MRLIITRHGETIENKERIVQGHKCGTLTDLGLEQAKKLANRLKNEKIDFIYSSDLERASDTAKEIIKFHPNTPIKFIKELRERSFGKLEGKSYDIIGPWSNVENLVKENFGIESTEEMMIRAKRILEEAIKKHPNKTVLFVGHGGLNMTLEIVIKNGKVEDMKEMNVMKNTAIHILDIDEDKNHKFYLYNCTEHLV